MCFCVARVIRKLPRRCTSITVSQSSSDILNSRLSRSTPGVVDQDGGGTQLVGHPADGRLDLVGLAHVGADPEGAAARVGDLLDRAQAGLLVQVQHGDGHAVGGQAAGDARADAAPRSGHDGNSLCLLRHSRPSPIRVVPAPTLLVYWARLLAYLLVSI